ncbi:MAG: type II secretion system minor pseudopilin GspJ [Pseudomonadota bacterium]
MASPSQKGLTLVELLIALMVFAFVSAAAVGVMTIASQGESQVTRVTQTLSELERARSLLRNDLLQIVDRSYGDSFTTAPLPPMLGGDRARNMLEEGDGETILMAFVRRGWANPGAAQPRASLQHVTYLVKEETLIRRTRPFLDAVTDTPQADQVLLNNVEDIRIRFLNGLNWQEDWEALPRQPAPDAVRLNMMHPIYGELTQDFLSGGAS